MWIRKHTMRINYNVPDEVPDSSVTWVGMSRYYLISVCLSTHECNVCLVKPDSV